MARHSSGRLQCPEPSFLQSSLSSKDRYVLRLSSHNDVHAQATHRLRVENNVMPGDSDEWHTIPFGRLRHTEVNCWPPGVGNIMSLQRYCGTSSPRQLLTWQDAFTTRVLHMKQWASWLMFHTASLAVPSLHLLSQ